MTAQLDWKETASRSEPKKVALSELATKRLLAYASVASLGVACIPRAEAEVVYTSVHRNIDLGYALDLNNDGIIDFHIFSYELSSFSSLSVKPAIKANRIAAVHVTESCYARHGSAAALPAGAVIGPGGSFKKSATCMFSGYDGHYGPWVDVQNRYLGLAFVIDGEIHYGWARISVNPNYCLGCEARIEGYAYETEVGKAILAGDEGGAEQSEEQSRMTPGSLGALAMGAAGR
jgi:hypothetical protein